jgi:hypothetical protein
MLQIKIFKGLESELSVLESEVNAWLAEEGGRVLQVVGNIAQQSITTMGKHIGLSTTDFVPSDVLLVVVYDKLS